MLTRSNHVQPLPLISPYGEKLINLVVSPEAVNDLKAYASRLPSIQLSERSLCDLELLACGGFSPLDRFMSRGAHQRVLEEMRLSSGYLFPIPVTLPVDPGPAIHLDRDIALRNAKNDLLAIMTIEDVYEWDVAQVAQALFGTLDAQHPGAEMHRWGKLNISGRLQVLQLPHHPDFQEFRLNPAQTRARLEDYASKNVIAFQTQVSLHRAHEELIKRAIQRLDGVVLLHPVVGLTKPGDVDHYTRVRTYKALVRCAAASAPMLLALLPLAPRFAGPREVLWHALIHRNYGANYLIAGRDYTNPGIDSHGKPLYGPHEAQALVEQYAPELGVGLIPYEDLVYLPDEDRYEEMSRVSSQTRTASLSETQVHHEYLNKGRKLPGWYSRAEVAEVLAEAYPPRHQQGVCIWFTGLSGSGKSTTAEALAVLLLECGRQATVLDGDVVRTHLSKGLGFSKDDRDTNIRRIGFVAAEIVRHSGVAICAAVSPYLMTRNEVRSMVGAEHFIEVFVDTPLEICEERDAKGMYAKARRGEITGFTGIDDPYEPPTHPEMTLDTVAQTPGDNARRILNYLAKHGFVRTATIGEVQT
jgi:sulfate adenylyltransferase